MSDADFSYVIATMLCLGPQRTELGRITAKAYD